VNLLQHAAIVVVGSRFGDRLRLRGLFRNDVCIDTCRDRRGIVLGRAGLVLDGDFFGLYGAGLTFGGHSFDFGRTGLAVFDHVFFAIVRFGRVVLVYGSGFCILALGVAVAFAVFIDA